MITKLVTKVLPPKQKKKVKLTPYQIALLRRRWREKKQA